MGYTIMMDKEKRMMNYFREANGGFWQGFFAGIGALGYIRRSGFNPPRYPRNAQFLDQERIGNDMYRAMECFNEEETETY